MWEIDDCESSEELTHRLETEWYKCMNEYNQAVQKPLKKDSTAIYKISKKENENDEALILNVIIFFLW